MENWQTFSDMNDDPKYTHKYDQNRMVLDLKIKKCKIIKLVCAK